MNIKKMVILFIVFTLIASFGTSVLCKEKAITFNIGGDPSTIDPAKSSTVNEGTALVQMFDGLVRTNPEGELAPAIAESWDISPDGLVYTFKLRDAKFTNGDTITAEDFVYSWTRVMDPRTGSPYGYLMTYIQGANELNSIDISAADAETQIQDAMDNLGVEAVDDKTLKVTLVAPAPYFLGLTSFPVYFPVDKKVVEENDAWADSADTYVSNGPFKLVNWAHGQKLSLVKNDQYWDKENVKLDKVDLLIIEQGSTEVTMFETGQLDVVWGWDIPITEVQRLKKEGKVGFTNQIQNRYQAMNTQKPPFDDPRIRKALLISISREPIATNVMGNSVPLYAYVPRGLPDADPSKDFRDVGGKLIEENIEEAKRLLAEAGYPDGEGFPGFEILYTTNEKNKAIVEALAGMWSKNLNLKNITLKNVEGRIRSQLRRAGDFQMTNQGWAGDYLDPLTFLEIFLSDSGQNDGKWANAEYDRLVHVAQTTFDRGERYASMHAAEKILMDDAGCIPFSTEEVPYMQNPKLKGILRNALAQTDLKWAYFED